MCIETVERRGRHEDAAGPETRVLTGGPPPSATPMGRPRPRPTTPARVTAVRRGGKATADSDSHFSGLDQINLVSTRGPTG